MKLGRRYHYFRSGVAFVILMAQLAPLPASGANPIAWMKSCWRAAFSRTAESKTADVTSAPKKFVEIPALQPLPPPAIVAAEQSEAVQALLSSQAPVRMRLSHRQIMIGDETPLAVNLPIKAYIRNAPDTPVFEAWITEVKSEYGHLMGSYQGDSIHFVRMDGVEGSVYNHAGKHAENLIIQSNPGDFALGGWKYPAAAEMKLQANGYAAMPTGKLASDLAALKPGDQIKVMRKGTGEPLDFEVIALRSGKPNGTVELLDLDLGTKIEIRLPETALEVTERDGSGPWLAYPYGGKTPAQAGDEIRQKWFQRLESGWNGLPDFDAASFRIRTAKISGAAKDGSVRAGQLRPFLVVPADAPLAKPLPSHPNDAPKSVQRLVAAVAHGGFTKIDSIRLSRYLSEGGFTGEICFNDKFKYGAHQFTIDASEATRLPDGRMLVTLRNVDGKTVSVTTRELADFVYRAAWIRPTAELANIDSGAQKLGAESEFARRLGYQPVESANAEARIYDSLAPGDEVYYRAKSDKSLKRLQFRSQVMGVRRFLNLKDGTEMTLWPDEFQAAFQPGTLHVRNVPDRPEGALLPLMTDAEIAKFEEARKTYVDAIGRQSISRFKARMDHNNIDVGTANAASGEMAAAWSNAQVEGILAGWRVLNRVLDGIKSQYGVYAHGPSTPGLVHAGAAPLSGYRTVRDTPLLLDVMRGGNPVSTRNARARTTKSGVRIEIEASSIEDAKAIFDNVMTSTQGALLDNSWHYRRSETYTQYRPASPRSRNGIFGVSGGHVTGLFRNGKLVIETKKSADVSSDIMDGLVWGNRLRYAEPPTSAMRLLEREALDRSSKAMRAFSSRHTSEHQSYVNAVRIAGNTASPSFFDGRVREMVYLDDQGVIQETRGHLLFQQGFRGQPDRVAVYTEQGIKEREIPIQQILVTNSQPLDVADKRYPVERYSRRNWSYDRFSDLGDGIGIFTHAVDAPWMPLIRDASQPESSRPYRWILTDEGERILGRVLEITRTETGSERIYFITQKGERVMMLSDSIRRYTGAVSLK
ncbi:MAG: hypothetical protein AAB425_03310 [Bdellovibrionota bacterium]